jgi:hypothetical protein
MTAQGTQAPPPRDPFAAIKHINLTSNGSVWIGFGGYVRQRFETFKGFNFGAPPNADPDDGFSITRVFASADLHLGSNVRLFGEGKSALATRPLPTPTQTDGRRPIDVDELDLQQLYGELRFPGVGRGAWSLRVGRQEMAFGRERLISPLDWANTRRTFEGVTSTWTGPNGALSAFWARPVMVRRYDFNRRDSSIAIYGLYATARRPSRNLGADLYWIGLLRQNATFNSTTGREKRHTVGARVWGPLRRGPGLDYDVEVAGQFGSVGPGDIRAYMLGSQVGYNIRGRFSPRVYVGLDYASGDDTTGGDVQTFNQLYPLAHAYLGFLDCLGRLNVVDLSAGGSFRPTTTVTALVDLHRFSRASSGDAMYGPLAPFFGTPRGPGTTTSKDIGTELDLTLRWQALRYLTVMSGYSYFWPGQFIDDTGAANGTNLNQSFAFVGAQFVM